MPTSPEYHRSGGGGLNSVVRSAFLSVCSGYSPDRIVADPELNAIYLAKCVQIGLVAEPVQLNKSLLNLRKMGLLSDVQTTSRTSFPGADSDRYASEVAVRFLEKRDCVTLDEIICDPERANEFDSIADSIVPGCSSLEYRWAALNLRKSRRLKPEIMSHVIRPTGIQLGPVSGLRIADLPASQGLYVFHSATNALYVGEAENLRVRLAKHVDHSDNRDLARWFWEHGITDVALEIQELPHATSKKVRRALEAELIRSRNPAFNVQSL
jgi:predicted GIY-YIG superfamily endonuclease